MTEIFLDTETTGISFKEGHRVLEIACIETQDLIPTNNVFHKIINPQRDVPDEAFKVHGFSSEFLKDKVLFKDIVEEFLIFVKNKKIIIHNAPFDLGFLNNELKLLKRDKINNKEIIDTLELARNKYPGGSNSLDALCKRFNIDLTRRKKHNALLDCELLREVYINLLGVKEPKLIFSREENIRDENLQKKNISYSKKIIKPSNDELDNHKIFLKREFKKNNY